MSFLLKIHYLLALFVAKGIQTRENVADGYERW